MKKLITGIFLICFTIQMNAQEINDYKYVIIPESFQFTDAVNKYKLNSLAKFLFNKKGYNTLMKGESRPEDLKANPCLGLNAKLTDNSNLFVTKVTLQLYDCGDVLIFETKEGISREKEYEAAYQGALRDAFASFNEIDYKYVEPSEPENKPETGVVVIPSVKEQFSEKSDTDKTTVEKTEVEKNEVAEVATEITEDMDDIKSEVVAKSITERTYQYSGKSFSLKETAQGLGLYPEDSSEPIAILIETNDGGSFIYNTLTNQGIAYFDDKDNLIIEYFDRQKNKKVSLSYKVNNQ